MTANGPFTVGSITTYTIIVTNSGSAEQDDNPGNELMDILPAQLALVSAAASSGTAVANVGTNTATWNGSIAPIASVTITIKATILPGAAGTAVTNQATVFFDNDYDGSNESTALTDDPAAAGFADPTVFLVPGPVDTPTLSTVGLMILAILTAGLALALLKRRQQANKVRGDSVTRN